MDSSKYDFEAEAADAERWQQAAAEVEPITIDTDAELKRLAALSVAEYEAQRKEAAERLGMRAGVLDAEIKKIRGAKAAKSDEPFEVVDPWPHKVDGAALLDDINRTIRRFIICEPETAIAASLWVAMTWLIDAVQVAPLAVITAPEMRCGKSQLLFLMGKLVARPLAASGISPAALFRCIDAWRPTLLIDETDALLKENEELRGLLNAGHTRDSAYVIRAVAMGDDFKPQKFSVWGAKVLCGIGTLATTIMDRAVILELRRKLSHENVERLRHADTNSFRVMVSKLARWTADNASAITRARPDLPEALNDRAQDNWEPLLAIADTAGGRWPQLARHAALKISSDKASESMGAELLADIKTAFEREAVSRLSTLDLVNALCEDTEAPWATWNRGKPMSPRQLGKKLSAYGVVSKTMRMGTTTAKGYELAQLEDAFARYLIAPPDLSVTSVTSSQVAETLTFSVTEEKHVTEPPVTVTPIVTQNPRVSAGCDFVTEKTPACGNGAPDSDPQFDEWSDSL